MLTLISASKNSLRMEKSLYLPYLDMPYSYFKQGTNVSIILSHFAIPPLSTLYPTQFVHVGLFCHLSRHELNLVGLGVSQLDEVELLLL